MSERHVVSLSGGKDSTAMLLMLIERGVPFGEVVFFDTGWEFPEMYEHIDKLETDTGIPITRLHDSVGLTERMLHNHRTRGKRMGNDSGFGWPTPLARWCTTIKTSTIDRHCKGRPRYIGIAADEAHRCKGWDYPLVEWGVTEADALAYCKARGYDWGGVVRPLPPRLVLLLPIAVARGAEVTQASPSQPVVPDARVGSLHQQAAGQGAGQVPQRLQPARAGDAIQAGGQADGVSVRWGGSMTYVERRDAARKAIGRNVRRLLHEHGVTATEVAEQLGHDPNALYRICNGSRMPSALTAKRLADAIGCTVDEIVEGVGE